MRIVIVGAGAVGSYLAERLSNEGQDVVVIDADVRRVRELQGRMDALVIAGNGASAGTLDEAGVSHADLLIAVTSNDGVNALACHTAADLGVKTTIARIEDPELRPGMEAIGVDVVIDPEQTAAGEVLRLVIRSGSSDFTEFAGGQLVMLGDIIERGNPLIGRSLAELRSRHREWDWNAAVIRDGRTVVARGDTELEERDHVVVMTTADNVDRTTDLLGARRTTIHRAIVLGGTRVAELATDMLQEAGLEVVVVDPDPDRAHILADRHPRVLVIQGDPTDPRVLSEQTLSEHDAVVALSGWDEVNVVGCLLAKALGAGTAVARFDRVSYVRLLIGTGIDAAVSSRLAAANAILRFVRRGEIRSVVTFKDSDAEALDIRIADGSTAAGSTLAALPLNPLAVVGGVYRDGAAFIPRGDTVLEAGDGLIVFAPPEAIGDVEAMCGA